MPPNPLLFSYDAYKRLRKDYNSVMMPKNAQGSC